MTTEGLENLIQDPDVFALGIDSGPIKEVLVEIAQRVDSLQMKLQKQQNPQNSFDNDEIRDINIRLNELSKAQQQQNTDFTNEVHELKQFFNYQMKDLRETFDKSEKALNDRISGIQIPTPTIIQTQSKPSEPVVQYVPQTIVQEVAPKDDGVQMKKLTYDVQALKERIDSLISTINLLKEERTMPSVKIDQIPTDDTYQEKIPTPKLDTIKNQDIVPPANDLVLTPINQVEERSQPPPKVEISDVPQSETTDPNITDLYSKLSALSHDVINNRDKISTITKTTNKIIVEFENQHQEFVKAQHANSTITENIDKLHQKTSEIGYESDKKTTNLKSIIDDIVTKMDKQIEQIRTLSKTPTIEPIALPDFDKLFNDMKGNVQEVINENDTNYRKQFNYLKNELTSLKVALKDVSNKDIQIKETTPPPEMAPPPTIKAVEVPVEVPQVKEPEPPQEIIESPKSSPKVATFTTAPPVTKVEEEEEQPPVIVESPIRSHVPSSRKVYNHAEIQTDPAELEPIPVERVSFGTPIIMSMPNSIQTQFIIDRSPAPITYCRPFIRSNSVKLVTVRTNTPKYKEGDTKPLKPNKGVAEVVSETVVSNEQVVDEAEPIENVSVGVSPVPSRHSASVTPRVKFTDSATESSTKTVPMYKDYVDIDIQTDISVYSSMGTTPIPSRQHTATKETRQEQILPPPQPVQQPVQQTQTKEPLPTIDSDPETKFVKVEQEKKPEMPNYSNIDHPDMAYMEQYDTHAEKYIEPKKSSNLLQFNRSNSIQYLVLKHDLIKEEKISMQKSMSLERMLNLNIVGQSLPSQNIIINADPKDGFTKEDQDELVKRLTAASNPKRLDKFEQLLAQYHDEVSELESKISMLPFGTDKKIMDIEQILNRWIGNVQMIHRRVNELSDTMADVPKKKTMFVSMVEQKDGMISIPPSQKVEVPIDTKTETTTSAVMEPEIVIQMKRQVSTGEKRKPPELKLSFANNEMLNQAPKQQPQQKQFANTFELDVRPEDAMIGKGTISEQFQKCNERIEALKLVVTKFENDLYHIEHEVQEMKASQPDAETLKPIIEHHYHHARRSHSTDSSKKDKNTALGDSNPSSVTQSMENPPNPDSEEKEKQNEEKPNEEEEEEKKEEKTEEKKDENKPDMGERPHSPEKPKTPPKLEPAEILTSDEKNMLVYKIQFAPYFFIDQKPPEQTKSQEKNVASMVAALDTENITIPRYDEQIRIMRDALVDLRTNLQLIRQRYDERINQITTQQIEMNKTGDNAADSAALMSLKKNVDEKFDDFEGQFKFLRQEMYEFMKDRPERIIEKVKEVVVKNESDKKEKKEVTKKKHEKKEKPPPPPPPPPPELDVDFSIKKTKKLIGNIESPRVFKVNHLETLSSPDDSTDDSEVIIDEDNNPINIGGSRRSSFRPKQSSADDTSATSDSEEPESSDLPTRDDSKDQSSRTEGNTARKEDGHYVPQLIDEVSVYNALPKSDYTDKLVPMMVKMRDELKTYIDKVSSRNGKLEKVVRDKCAKDYVESFFRKMRVIIQATHEKVKTVVDALPQRITRTELEERLQNLAAPSIEKEAYAAQSNTAYSRCLFCGSKLPPGRTDLGNPEANGGKPIPPRSNIVNNEKGVVYKGRQSVGSIPTMAPLPPIGTKPKSPTSQSVKEEANDLLPKL
ncbi:hypothetical protein TVAG_099920 [Trichomonas vaginalis G3]|uniref:Uncharacterized protein n=1 Tax=Trichomonas vaginalis (strain ATCC PRA-98 / G3) TaxID=412133 RepID=A2EK59_TRIV3|nr:A-type inclusion protein-related family [Trichomonas vaginalis G3]EAY06952.1 hypothetical protein TVAG_099920 [Trichomonas vaginalis G3]KAI5499103.1 A-type inclusion protein-related family [Trichomonas vaginalis G3]|eukprot:XP_001319175.1 hypothetical protein [Trichomonas vaginalis G3]